MNHIVSHEDLMRFLDGELEADRKAEVARHVEGCTECKREFVVFETMKSEFRAMIVENGTGPSVWGAVSRRLVQPTAWMLIVIGAAAWAAWGAYAWFLSPEHFALKLAEGAVVLGLALLLAVAIGDRLRDLKTDPYREIQR